MFRHKLMIYRDYDFDSDMLFLAFGTLMAIIFVSFMLWLIIASHFYEGVVLLGFVDGLFIMLLDLELFDIFGPVLKIERCC